MEAMETLSAPVPVWVFLLLVLGAAIGFVALFKSGKREPAVDAELEKVANNEKLPMVIRQMAAKARDLELTAAANKMKAAGDDLEAKVIAAVNKALGKSDAQ